MSTKIDSTLSSAAADLRSTCEWVKRLLGLEPGGPGRVDRRHRLRGRGGGQPYELEASLATKLEGGYSARIAAGYCWPWSDPRRGRLPADDVHIGDWAKPWNLKGDRSVGGAPAAALWATDPAGFGQVGCVYTAQGFEYDYVRRHPRARLRLARRQAGSPSARRTRTPTSGTRKGQPSRLRPARPQHLQGAADPRDARRHHLLHRPPDSATSPTARHVAATQLLPDGSTPTQHSTARPASAEDMPPPVITREGQCPNDELDSCYRPFIPAARAHRG